MTGGYQDLENGIKVCFSKGEYCTGDYWTIPARTATGNIEWPIDDSGKPLAKQRSGIYHHYCKLALVNWSQMAILLEIVGKNFCLLLSWKAKKKKKLFKLKLFISTIEIR